MQIVFLAFLKKESKQKFLWLLHQNLNQLMEMVFCIPGLEEYKPKVIEYWKQDAVNYLY